MITLTQNSYESVSFTPAELAALPTREEVLETFGRMASTEELPNNSFFELGNAVDANGNVYNKLVLLVQAAWQDGNGDLWFSGGGFKVNTTVLVNGLYDHIEKRYS